MSIAIKDGGSWRYPRSIEIKDGGVWRTAKTLSYKESGTWRHMVNFIGSMTVAKNFAENLFGFIASLGQGSLSPSSDVNSHVISGVYYNNIGGANLTLLTYSGSAGEYTGFNQTNFIKRILVAGVEVNTADCFDYGFESSDSVMFFRWTGDVFGLSSKDGQTVAVQITPA